MDGWAIAIALAGILVTPVSLAVQAWRQSKSEEAARKHELSLLDRETVQRARDQRVGAYLGLLEAVDDYMARTSIARHYHRRVAQMEAATGQSPQGPWQLDAGRLSAATAAIDVVGPSDVALVARELVEDLHEFSGHLHRAEGADEYIVSVEVFSAAQSVSHSRDAFVTVASADFRAQSGHSAKAAEGAAEKAPDEGVG